jgi:hypothetical protein
VLSKGPVVVSIKIWLCQILIVTGNSVAFRLILNENLGFWLKTNPSVLSMDLSLAYSSLFSFENAKIGLCLSFA